jgi:predicted ABC-type transport system involved in lysophospholipase L1 biosynthesis ATPase subunit
MTVGDRIEDKILKFNEVLHALEVAAVEMRDDGNASADDKWHACAALRAVAMHARERKCSEWVAALDSDDQTLLAAARAYQHAKAAHLLADEDLRYATEATARAWVKWSEKICGRPALRKQDEESMLDILRNAKGR